jgi:uncharacterized membrane protein
MNDLVLDIVFAANSLLLIGLAIPLMQRRVRPNRLYGFRTPTTLGDERIWYEVNAITGADLLWTGAGQLVLVVVHLLGSMPTAIFAAASVAWGLFGVLGMTAHGFAVIRRMRRN